MRPCFTQRTQDSGACRSASSDVRRGVTAIIHPPEVDPVDLAARHDGQVEGQVRKAPARLWISLDDVLEAFDDRRSAELDVTLHDGSTVPMTVRLRNKSRGGASSRSSRVVPACNRAASRSSRLPLVAPGRPIVPGLWSPK